MRARRQHRTAWPRGVRVISPQTARAIEDLLGAYDRRPVALACVRRPPPVELPPPRVVPRLRLPVLRVDPEGLPARLKQARRQAAVAAIATGALAAAIFLLLLQLSAFHRAFDPAGSTTGVALAIAALASFVLVALLSIGFRRAFPEILGGDG